MKKCLLIAALLISSLVTAETKHMGNYSFVNTDGKINLGINAAVAVRSLDNNYIPFVMYAACDNGLRAILDRSTIVMVYNGKEYAVPKLKVFRQNYKQDIKDKQFFRVMSEHLLTSDLNKHKFKKTVNFFPARNERVTSTDVAAINFLEGIRTNLYFENPGIKKGDTITIKVTDTENPEISGEIEFTL